jgi:hypothetical protein
MSPRFSYFGSIMSPNKIEKKKKRKKTEQKRRKNNAYRKI